MYFEKKKNESREPTETATVSKNVVLGLWSSADANGRVSFRWNLSRIGAEGRIRKTFQPEHLLEFPEAIRCLAKGFSQLKPLDEALRAELTQLAAVMEKAIESMKSNGLSVTNGSSTTGMRVFG